MGMRRVTGSIKHSPVSARSFFAGVFMSVLSVVLVTTCDFPPTFGDEYRDSSTNFIAGLPLDEPPPATDDGSTIPLDSLAIWDWAWRGQTGTGNDFEYMDMTDTGAVGSNVTSGSFTLASSAESWQLELVNLAGDPYSEGVLHPSWESNGTGSVSSAIATVSSHGKYVRLQSDNSAWAGFDPLDTLFILDNPASYAGNTYLLSAFSLKSTIRYIIGNNTTADFSDTKQSNLSSAKHVFDIFSVPDTNTRFMVGASNEDQDIDLDDLRILRTDIKEQLRLRIRLAPQDVTPSLVAGRYEFTLWIKAPTGSLAYDDTTRTGAGVSAPFTAPEVTLEMLQLRTLEGSSGSVLFRQTYPVTDIWTRIALRMEGRNMEQFDETSAEAVLELSIYPFNPQDPEVGGVMIADPRVRFFIDGYTN